MKQPCHDHHHDCRRQPLQKALDVVMATVKLVYYAKTAMLFNETCHFPLLSLYVNLRSATL